MSTQDKKWEILSKGKTTDIVKVLLKNRGIRTEKQKKEFLNPIPPNKLTLKELKISESGIKKSILRIKKAIKNNEKIIVYGDYDADGICATAILWEALHSLKANALPYIPERFSEGYGLNDKSVKKLKEEHLDLGLIITVDNGIVARRQVEKIKKLGIDVIITDHHQKGKKIPKAHSIIHTTEIGGAGIAWIFARELGKTDGLDLAAIGTVADQLPLVGPNRSLVKYGLKALNKTKRPGLLALFEKTAITKGSIGTYQIGFIIAPRINATGRLKHGIDSLRLLCTLDEERANNLALYLGKVNTERQKIVENVVLHAGDRAENKDWKGIILLSHESYHEGVVGLAASRLVGRFYRPAIVISQGTKLSKASARSIPGFNIIKVIRELEDMIMDGGGHPMAAGFSIETKKIKEFSKKLEEISIPLLTDELLTRKLKIDMEADFSQLNWKLLKVISLFEPTGINNSTPLFVTKGISVLNARQVGADGKHLKLTLENKGKVFDAIAFGFGNLSSKLSPGESIDAVYVFEENVWNGNRNLQLKIRDIRVK
jgi:single-stranded-DNA-specific exonuclease